MQDNARTHTRSPSCGSVSMDALYSEENIDMAKAKHLMKFWATCRRGVNMDAHSCHVCLCTRARVYALWARVWVCMHTRHVCWRERQAETCVCFVCVHLSLVFQRGLLRVWFPTILIRVVITESWSPQMEHIPPSHYQGCTHTHTICVSLYFSVHSWCAFSSLIQSSLYNTAPKNMHPGTWMQFGRIWVEHVSVLWIYESVCFGSPAQNLQRKCAWGWMKQLSSQRKWKQMRTNSKHRRSTFWGSMVVVCRHERG